MNHLKFAFGIIFDYMRHNDSKKLETILSHNGLNYKVIIEATEKK